MIQFIKHTVPKKKRQCSVYKITFPDGKIYIGITKNRIQKRFSVHLAEKTTSAVTTAIRKIGFDNIQFEILDKVDSKDEARKLEKHYIKKFNSQINGYNKTKGG